MKKLATLLEKGTAVVVLLTATLAAITAFTDVIKQNSPKEQQTPNNEANEG